MEYKSLGCRINYKGDLMKKKYPAVVKFIGDPKSYILACEDSSLRYCRDCEILPTCIKKHNMCEFTPNKHYNAYFLEYWQGRRNSIHVTCNTNEIVDFIPFEDFEIIEDVDEVLSNKEAIVRCITHEYDSSLFDIKYNKKYKAIGISRNPDKQYTYLVMDESMDCYFYPNHFFEIVEDRDDILDRENGIFVYDKSLFID